PAAMRRPRYLSLLAYPVAPPPPSFPTRRSSDLYTLRGGLDRWNGGRRAASVGGTLERRLFRDRVSVVLDAERWVSIGDAPDFGTTGVRAAWTSPLATGGWAYTAVGGLQRVSEGSPAGLWSGAGDGHARSELLRAHPLLDDRVINV